MSSIIPPSRSDKLARDSLEQKRGNEAEIRRPTRNPHLEPQQKPKWQFKIALCTYFSSSLSQ
jgi:hypothetical protein